MYHSSVQQNDVLYRTIFKSIFCHLTLCTDRSSYYHDCIIYL